jgi:hypothetical protein
MRASSSYVDGVSSSHTTRKLQLARSDDCPFAAWCAPAQRMSPDNSERTAASIRCEPSHGLVRNLLRAAIASDGEQPIAPHCFQYRQFRHGVLSSTSCRGLSELLNALRGPLSRGDLLKKSVRRGLSVSVSWASRRIAKASSIRTLTSQLRKAPSCSKRGGLRESVNQQFCSASSVPSLPPRTQEAMKTSNLRQRRKCALNIEHRQIFYCSFSDRGERI